MCVQLLMWHVYRCTDTLCCKHEARENRFLTLLLECGTGPVLVSRECRLLVEPFSCYCLSLSM